MPARAFVVRLLNIVDPLLPSNNLGRSVSRASYLRIRRAFAHGAKTLALVMEKVRLAIHAAVRLAGFCQVAAAHD